MLKKSVFIAATGYSIVLAIVSLIKSEDIPDIDIDNGDKVFHFLAYCILTFLWFGALVFNFNLKKTKVITYAAIVSFVFGIVIEVLQETITDSRTLDIYDVVANTFGVFIAVLLLVLKRILTLKKYKGLLF